ncbi:MAG: polysaccharide biosynthesis/export family protein [Acidobacteria bacterium]|nr:polysaccharide biosynthesis/export family protein [Acidobacteriota bacterium]MDW7985163.1 polysaccharide biosynthesis/export family protein [Acidobacteriota bacterium]
MNLKSQRYVVLSLRPDRRIALLPYCLIAVLPYGRPLMPAGALAQQEPKPPQFEIRNLTLALQEQSIGVILRLNIRPRSEEFPALPYNAFTLQNPTRIVVDFSYTRHRVRKFLEWDKSTGLRDLRLSTQEPCRDTCTTRLVLELEAPLAQWRYETRQDKDQFILQVQRVRPRPPQVPAGNVVRRDTQEPSAGLAAPKYYLGPGDQIEINIFELPDFNMTLRVAPDGTISVAPIGRIRVAGMTVQQVEETLRKHLQERYIQDPHVSVNIREFESQRYTIVGAVRSPGSFPLYRGKTLIMALAEVGGLAEGAGLTAYLYRLDEKGQYERYVIDLHRLLHEGDITEDVSLAAGDIVVVPRGVIQVYVYGAVQRPGIVQGARPLTVLQAILLAGGPSDRASLGGVRIIRTDGKVEKVDVGDIMRGTQKDVELSAGDRVFVPESLF